MSRRAVFFDRDGVLCAEAGYINHPSRLRLETGAADAVRSVTALGMLAVVVTNQSGVARGYLTPSILADTHRRLEGLLAEKGARLDGIYACMHHPDAGAPPLRRACDCRKPRAGLLEQAAHDLGVALDQSYLIGDRFSDIAAGRAGGVRGTVLLRCGYGRGELLAAAGASPAWPDRIADDLAGAVSWIAGEIRRRVEPGEER